METELRSHLIALAQAYAQLKGLEMVTVARLSAGDWRFFDRVGTGASFTARKYDEIVGWFASNWPEGVEQPAEPRRLEGRAA